MDDGRDAATYTIAVMGNISVSHLYAFMRMYRLYFDNREFIFAGLASTVLLCIGIVSNTFANVYATEQASNSVTDIVLSNMSVVDVDGVFVWGTFVLTVFVLVLALVKPQFLPFTFASLGLFYLIRTVFVSLTHLGPFPDHTVLDVGALIAKMIGGGDMFFSGHTGAPFLLALIFWKQRMLRYVFLVWSIFFAAVVLLGHLHYSIDVLSAFFITYTIFCISEFLFRKYRTLFYEGVQN